MNRRELLQTGLTAVSAVAVAPLMAAVPVAAPTAPAVVDPVLPPLSLLMVEGMAGVQTYRRTHPQSVGSNDPYGMVQHLEMNSSGSLEMILRLFNTKNNRVAANSQQIENDIFKAIIANAPYIQPMSMGGKELSITNAGIFAVAKGGIEIARATRRGVGYVLIGTSSGWEQFHAARLMPATEEIQEMYNQYMIPESISVEPMMFVGYHHKSSMAEIRNMDTGIIVAIKEDLEKGPHQSYEYSVVDVGIHKYWRRIPL